MPSEAEKKVLLAAYSEQIVATLIDALSPRIIQILQQDHVLRQHLEALFPEQDYEIITRTIADTLGRRGTIKQTET